MRKLDVTNALRDNQLIFFYQPQVDHCKNIVSVEALVRWKHPVYGVVSPNEFLPFINEIEILNQLNLWVTKSACDTLKRWESEPELQRLAVSINISPFTSTKKGFLDDIFQFIKCSDINTKNLKIEITEQSKIIGFESTINAMKIIQESGVEFSLDDFGTGFSSFKYLQELPIQELKIDKRFVDDIDKNLKNLSIAKSIVKLGQDLNLQVIAEGIETEIQWDVLKNIGCKYFQGYYFYKPQARDDIESIHDSNNKSSRIEKTPVQQRHHFDQTDFLKIEYWKQSSISQIHQGIKQLVCLEDLNFFFEEINSNSAIKSYFLYYCWFFSDTNLLDNFLNRNDTPLTLIREIIFEGLSLNEDCMRPADYFSFWTTKFSPEQSLKLLIDTGNYQSHPILIAYLISNFDAKTWETFFLTFISEEPEIYKFLKLFEEFTISERERLLILNNTLSKYFNLLITLVSIADDDPFLKSLKNSIDKVLGWEDYVVGLKSTFSIEEELYLPPHLRNVNRLSCIMHDTLKLQEEERLIFLKYLSQNDVIVDTQELSILTKVTERKNGSLEVFAFS